MKMFKKTLCIILTVITLIGCTAVVSFAEGNDVTVSLRIEGITECLYYGNITVSKGSTVFDVIKAADEKDDSLDVTFISTELYGSYITSINGITAGTYTTMMWDGWLYMVDDVSPDSGVSYYTVSDGEKIVMYYADMGKIGIQYPTIDTSKISKGMVSFTSVDTVYDNDYNAVEQVNPVKGYTLLWGYKDETIEITPDENGVCKIQYKYLTLGKHSLQIVKYDETTGLPTVLRYAPDFTVSVNIFNVIASFFNRIIEAVTSIFAA